MAERSPKSRPRRSQPVLLPIRGVLPQPGDSFPHRAGRSANFMVRAMRLRGDGRPFHLAGYLAGARGGGDRDLPTFQQVRAQHLFFPVRGIANFVLTVGLDAVLPPTSATLILVPIRLYSAVLGFEERGSEYKTSPADDKITHFTKTGKPWSIVDEQPKKTATLRETLYFNPIGGYQRNRGVLSVVALTIVVMLCIQIPWSSSGEMEESRTTSCPGTEGFAPCHPWHTVATYTVRDSEQCCAFCDQASECHGWVFKNHKHSCWLFQYVSCPNGVCTPCQSYRGQFYGVKVTE
eukprot:GEMP01063320.1.p1 GENE.GEMP01063320.1~~GEMP01063320.1.p1  ORF type:complete len:292 (+),score=28.37 GEMP01063320.1:87-962(+)